MSGMLNIVSASFLRLFIAMVSLTPFSLRRKLAISNKCPKFLLNALAMGSSAILLDLRLRSDFDASSAVLFALKTRRRNGFSSHDHDQRFFLEKIITDTEALSFEACIQVIELGDRMLSTEVIVKSLSNVDISVAKEFWIWLSSHDDAEIRKAVASHCRAHDVTFKLMFDLDKNVSNAARNNASGRNLFPAMLEAVCC